ncbi:hypothetical protein [Embleya sp. NPDC005971]|uniref:hypothetical protein n=1 Tax=Embleya sp. NPDC005971 TaxID=3156724 RepID=UPI0033C262EA
MSPYGEDRLPGHERRRRELLAMLDTDRPSRTRALLPGVAAGAVLVVCAGAILAAQPWRDPQHPTPAGPVVGQDPAQGVAREMAKPGDPVPWDVATRTLTACLAQGRRAAVPPPQPTGFTAPPPTMPPPGSGAPGTAAPPSMGYTPPPGTPPASAVYTGDMPTRMPEKGLPTGSTATPPGWPTQGSIAPPGSSARPPGASAKPDPKLWQVREPDTAFKPYFTAWELVGDGELRPFVLGKAGEPGLVVCHGELSLPEFPTPKAADGLLAGAFEVRRTLAWTPPTVEPPRIALLSSTTWWGRTTGAVARVVVELPDGTTVGAVVRNGVWLASVPNSDTEPTRIRAYDAAGTLLDERTAARESLGCADAPSAASCGSRTHWG